MTPDRWARVEGLLAEGWSPEQVAGRLRLEGGWTVGRQWTSEHVRADRKAGGRLFLLLRRRGRKPNWRGGRHSGRGHIPGRVDISERPDEVERKERVGDWEADTIIGKGHSGAVVSLVDRASKYTYSRRVDRRTSAAVSAAMLEMPRPSAAPVHTITADNGKEFAGHAGVAEALGAAFHFATPCHFWERGLNGHTNGLVRQYLPKGTDLRAVTDAEVRAVQDRASAPGAGPPGARRGAAQGPSSLRPRDRLPPARAGAPGGGGMDFGVASVRAPVGLRPPCVRTDATRPGGGVAPPGKPG